MTHPVIEHMTVKDVARALNVSVGKVHKLITDPEHPLPAVNVGRGSKAYWRIARDDFDAYLTDQRAITAARFRKSA